MAPELGLNIACLDRCIEFSCILPLLAGAKARVFTTPKGHMIVGSCRGQIDHDPDERKLAVKAAKALNLTVAGVDIIRSNRGPLLLEVNSSPGLQGIESSTGKDIANVMIESIEKKLGYKSE